MPGLYRCRASASEIAKLFAAETSPDLSWSPMSWPGAAGLVVRAHGNSRRVESMRWGLAPGSAPPGMTSKAAEIATVRDLLAPAAFGHALPTERCLIIVEAFAFPDGDKGARTRTWFGLWDQPLFAWAGLCRREGGKGWGFVGAVTTPNALVGRVGDHMPIMLGPDEQEVWLHGRIEQLLTYRRAWPAEQMFAEPSDEPWSPRSRD